LKIKDLRFQTGQTGTSQERRKPGPKPKELVARGGRRYGWYIRRRKGEDWPTAVEKGVDRELLMAKIDRAEGRRCGMERSSGKCRWIWQKAKGGK